MSGLKKQIPAKKAFIIEFALIIIPGLIIIIYTAFIILEGIISGPPSPPSIDSHIQQMEIFNSQFEQFEGKMKGTEIKELLSRISSLNYSWSNRDALEVTSWRTNKKSSNHKFISNLIKKVDLEATYTVTFDYDNEGWITCINIEQN